MSELKVYRDPQEGPCWREFYEKSEADKVIAEKDAKILALDAEVFKQKHHARLFLDERNYAENQLSHQKYKRCLAMYHYCAIKALYELDCKGNDVEWKWYSKWMHKWYKLAEKFKEAK